MRLACFTKKSFIHYNGRIVGMQKQVHCNQLKGKPCCPYIGRQYELLNYFSDILLGRIEYKKNICNKSYFLLFVIIAY